MISSSLPQLTLVFYFSSSSTSVTAQLNRIGAPHENKTSECYQLLSTGADGTMMVWDTRPPPVKPPANASQKEKEMVRLRTFPARGRCRQRFRYSVA